MHCSESITKGSVIAFVGHFSIHFSHTPHRDWEELSGVKSSERIKKPKVSHDPNSLLIRLLFLPIQPRPASSAHAFSRSGDVSTQIFHLQFGTSVLIHLPIFFNFLVITL